MKKILIVLFVFLLFFQLNAKISLKEAVNSGISKNFKMKSLLLDRDIFQLEKKIREGARLFKLNLSGSYLYRSEKIHMQLPDVAVSPQVTIPGLSFDAGTLHNFDLNLSIMQPLYTGNILLNSVKIGKERENMNSSIRDVLKLRISSQIKSSYFRFRLLLNRIELIRVTTEKINTHLKRIESLLKEGLARKSDLLETRLKKEELNLELNGVKADIHEEKSRFRELCGLDVVDIEEEYHENVLPREAATETFIQSHPQMKIFEKRDNIFSFNKKIISGGYLPQIGFFSEFHYGKPGINFFENEWKFYLQAGISVSLNIFDWSRGIRERRIVKYERSKLNNEKEDFISTTKMKLEYLYNKISLLKESIITAEKLRQDSSEDSMLKKNLYEEKQISNLDYLDSLLNVKKYETLKNKIILQLELVKIAVNSLIGREVTQ